MSTIQPDTRTLAEYLNALRSGDPTPGGGSAAAYSAAMGAALLAMVCRLTLKSADVAATEILEPAASRLDALVLELSVSARDDEECYGRYRAAAALPKSSPEEKQSRTIAMQASLHTAAETPLLTARRAVEALRLAAIVARDGTKHALSDVETARLLLSAAIEGALLNVEVNVAMIKDAELAASLQVRVDEIRSLSSAASEAVIAALLDRR